MNNALCEYLAASACAEAARLTPIFRSDTQLQILGATYLEPERQFTIPELIERSSRSYVDVRLGRADVVRPQTLLR